MIETLSPVEAPAGRLIVRRPIHDRRRKVLGYSFVCDDGNYPARELLTQGMARLAHDKVVFVVHHVESDIPDVSDLNADQIIVHLIGETPEPIIVAAASLKAAGARVAVSQNIFEQYGERLEAFVKYVVINPNGQYDPILMGKIKGFKRGGIRMIGIDVNDYRTHYKCMAIGFDYFIGSFISKPMVAGRTKIPLSRMSLINMMTRLQDPTISINEIERLVETDPMLGYRLLRLVNSAFAAQAEPVESLRTAIVLLGNQRIANLVSILTYQQIEDKPSELTLISLIRAKTAEIVATETDLFKPEKFFTAGLLSVLDAMFDVPMYELVSELPLTQEIGDALIDPEAEDNEVAHVLYNVYALEEARFTKIYDVDHALLGDAYLKAITWAEDALAA